MSQPRKLTKKEQAIAKQLKWNSSSASQVDQITQTTIDVGISGSATGNSPPPATANPTQQSATFTSKKIPGKAVKYGMSGGRLKQQVSIVIESNDNNASVQGGIGEGSAQSMASQWDSPFEQFIMGNTKFSTTAAGISALSGLSVINKTTMTQVWRGTRPISFDLSMIFIADVNGSGADSATSGLVNIALEELARMIHPEPATGRLLSDESNKLLNSAINFLSPTNLGAGAGGAAKAAAQSVVTQPDEVSITIGNKIYPFCIIESMSFDLDAPRDQNGYYLYNVAKLSCHTRTMQFKDDIEI